jgi:hypothetical protein
METTTLLSSLISLQQPLTHFPFSLFLFLLKVISPSQFRPPVGDIRTQNLFKHRSPIVINSLVSAL